MQISAFGAWAGAPWASLTPSQWQNWHWQCACHLPRHEPLVSLSPSSRPWPSPLTQNPVSAHAVAALICLLMCSSKLHVSSCNNEGREAPWPWPWPVILMADNMLLVQLVMWCVVVVCPLQMIPLPKDWESFSSCVKLRPLLPPPPCSTWGLLKHQWPSTWQQSKEWSSRALVSKLLNDPLCSPCAFWYFLPHACSDQQGLGFRVV